MAKNDITGFEFPVFDSDGKVIPGSEMVLKYDYNSLANIPETCVTETKDEYKIDNNVRVTKNLQTLGDLKVDGKTTFGDMIVLSNNSFGDTLPTTDEHVAGRVFFVKLQ